LLVEVDTRGRMIRNVRWDVEDLDAAYAELDARWAAGEAAAHPLASKWTVAKPNAATAATDRWQALAEGGDWDAVRAGCAPGMIFEDRQGFALLSGGSALQIASLRERRTIGARAERRVMGTAGERVAVLRMLWSGGPADGRFEIEDLCVIE